MNAAEIFTQAQRTLIKTYEDDSLGWEGTLSYLSQIMSDLDKLEIFTLVSVSWVNGESQYDHEIFYVPWVEGESEQDIKTWAFRMWHDYLTQVVEVDADEIDRAQKYDPYSLDHIHILNTVIVKKQEEQDEA